MEGLEELSLDNIMDVGDDVDLFEEVTPEDKGDDNPGNNEEETKTTEVNPEDLFDTPEEKPESVGSEENNEGKEDTTSTEDGKSPNNFYSSVAKAFVDDGVFTQDDDMKVETAEDFTNLMKKQVENMLDETQKRVNDALNAGVEPSEIQKYERGISQLEGITEEQLSAEGEQGENLRKWVIYNDYLSRGFSKERAEREVEKSIKSGDDITDAQDSLSSIIDHYKNEYSSLINNAKEEEKKFQEERKKETEGLRKSILEDKLVFGDVEIDKATRQRAFDVISKPIYKDPNTGELLTEMLKYMTENKADYLKNMGILYAFTNGFKDINKLVKSKVTKEMNKGIRELERTLNNTSRNSSGNISFASGVGDDSESYIGKGLKLDL